jgi:molybdopterin-synthase adenylyltransferase
MTADRFSRHRALIGEEGLSALQNATVTVCGAGGLGSTVLTLLARTGVGTLHIYDYGRVDEPDLNRQTLYTARDIGSEKAVRAAELLSELGAGLTIHAHPQRIDGQTDFSDCDLVVDCLDNFATRFLVDSVTYDAGIPLVHAGVYKYFGQVTSILKGETRPLRELFAESAAALDSEANKPMFPAAVVAVAATEASEVIRILLPAMMRPAGGAPLFRTMVTVDLATCEMARMPFL